MRAIVQRVAHASVDVDGATVGKCGRGLMVLLGVAPDDSEADAEFLCRKIVNLRIFRDENEKMNRSLADIDGEMLVISQFTLFANCQNGNRPDFFGSAKPETAIPLYEKFVALAKEQVKSVETGIFGADMKVSLLNDGPVTVSLDTETLMKNRK